MQFLSRLTILLVLTIPVRTSGNYRVVKEISPADAGSPLMTFVNSKEFLTGHINYTTDTNFVEIPAQFAYREGMYLLRDVYQAWYRMYLRAKADDVYLKIISASRTFTEQSWIWEDKWKSPKYASTDTLEKIKSIIRFSAMPGTSRHHWGTEVDINSISESYFESPVGVKTYNWLQEHASEFGFCQVYSQSYQSDGHGEEKWHWSYYPISQYLPGFYADLVNYADLEGFSGCIHAASLHVIENYVLNISNECDELIFNSAKD